MAANITRSMPCNVEAEQYVLGAAIFDNTCIPDIMSSLKSDEFYLEQHKLIFNAMMEISNNAEPVDFPTLKSRLGLKFDSVGGIEYLTKIRLMVSTTSNLKYHIKIIKDKITDNASKSITFVNIFIQNLLRFTSQISRHYRLFMGTTPIHSCKADFPTCNTHYIFLQTDNSFLPMLPF